MPLYIDKLKQSDVNDHIFNNIITGFHDTNPHIREQTLKAITLLAPKLSSKTINNTLLRLLAKLQNDPEPGIRTNTIVCLVKISLYLNDSLKPKVLSTAFVRGLHDPFPPAKKAALGGLASSSSVFDSNDMAGKLLPNMCPLLVFADKGIRDQARVTIGIYMKKLQEMGDVN